MSSITETIKRNKTEKEVSVERRSFTIDEMCVAHRVGRTTLFLEIKSKRLVVKRIGRKILIPVESAEAWLLSREA